MVFVKRVVGRIGEYRPLRRGLCRDTSPYRRGGKIGAEAVGCSAHRFVGASRARPQTTEMHKPADIIKQPPLSVIPTEAIDRRVE